MLALKGTRLDREEIESLTTAYQSGDNSAGWRLVMSTIGIITREAAKFAKCYGADEDDLRSEAMLLIFQALKRFASHECQLSTFVGVVLKRRLGRMAKQMAGRFIGPLEAESSDEVGSVTSASTYEHIERLFDDLDEAAKVAELTRMEIDALLLMAQGETKAKLAAKLRALHPHGFIGISKERSSSFAQHLISEATTKLREVLHVAAPPLEGASRDEVLGYACKLAVEHPHYSAERISVELTNRGASANASRASVHNELARRQLSTFEQRARAVG